MTSTILLVDDQHDILRLLHSTFAALNNEGLEIIEAPSGEEALLVMSQSIASICWCPIIFCPV